MLQFAILNASVISYEKQRKTIEDLENELKAYASRTENPELVEEMLFEARKKASREVRASITRGDVLQIEDFQMDLNTVATAKKRERTSDGRHSASPSKVRVNENVGVSGSVGSQASIKKIMQAVESYIEKKEYKEEINIRLS